MPTRTFHLRMGLMLTGAGLLIGLVWLLSPSGTAAALPGRATPTPTPLSTAGSGAGVGAIAVKVVKPPPWAWVNVQWLDLKGKWRDVETWPGELDKGGRAVRWVFYEHFGRGPFRWAVYEYRGGKLWAASENFYFPTAVGQWVEVTVMPPPTATPKPTARAKASPTPVKKMVTPAKTQ